MSQQKYNPFADLEQQISAKPLESELSSRPLKDTGIKLAQGAISLGDAVVGVGDMVTGGRATPLLQNTAGYDPDRAKEILSEELSGKQRLADQRVSEAEGFADTFTTALENPRAIFGTVTESLPLMLTGMGGSAMRARQIYKKAADAAGGANTPAGKLAGQKAVEDARGELIGTGAAIEGAQVSGLMAAEAEREGRDYSDYALPAAAAGLTTGLVGQIGGRVFGDAPTEVATKSGAGTTSTAKNPVLNKAGQVLKAGAVEAGEEGIQSSAETVYGNIAMGEEDVLDGVGESAAMGVLAGGAMGLGFGALQNLPNDPYSNILKKGEAELAAGTAPVPQEEAPAAETEPVPAEAATAPVDVTAAMPEASEQPEEQTAAEEVRFNSKGQPYKDEATATRAAAALKSKEKREYKPVPVDGGFALKPYDQEADQERIRQIADSETVNKLRNELNSVETGYGNQATQEAIDSDMDEAATVKYLKQRRKELQERKIAASTGKGNIDLLTGKPKEDPSEQQQTQAETEAQDPAETAGAPAVDDTFTDDNGISASDKLIIARDKLERALKANDDEAVNRYQSLIDRYVGEISAPKTVAPEPEQATAETESVTAEPSVTEQSEPKLPKDIAKAKPRYSYGDKKFTLAFDSDIDRAAYIAAQKKPSKRDADYVKFAGDATGMSEAEIRAYGAQVRDSIKAQAKDGQPGELRVPSQRQVSGGSNIEQQPVAETATATPSRNPSDYKDTTSARNIVSAIEEAEAYLKNSKNLSADDTANVTAGIAEMESRLTAAEKSDAAQPITTADGVIDEETATADGVITEEAAADVDDTDAADTTQAADSNDELPKKVWDSMNDGKSPSAEQVSVFKNNFPEWYAANVGDVDQAASEAAASPENDLPEPTDAQKEAGNYKKGHVKIAGLDISIENPKGSKRTGTDKDGNQWEVEMKDHYGYLRGTVGRDKDHVDVFMGEGAETADKVFIVDQIDPETGAFDEHKVMMGYASGADARRAYMANYSRGWKGFGAITAMPMADFKTWVADPSKTSRPAASKVKSEAPEHAQVGVDDRELSEIVTEFNEASESMQSGDDQIHHLFDKPKKSEIVRLQDKAKIYHKDHGWMTPAEAKEVIAQWKAHAAKQGETGQNSDRVVLSLFDMTGKWSQPWEEAGYQVFRFDIQNDPDAGDVNNFSTEFFQDWFGDFDGMDIYAVLAACPCTDFASSGSRHFAAKDADGRTVASVKLVHQTLATIEYFKPAIWAVENPVGRIEKLGGLPPWRLSFDPNHIGDPYTKKTLLWGRFNADLPVAPVEPTEGSKMHQKYGGKSLATKNARSVTPEGFAYGFFMANNAADHPVMAAANKYDRLSRDVIADAVNAGMTEKDIGEVIDDFYYMDLDDQGAEAALRETIAEREANQSSANQEAETVKNQGDAAKKTDQNPSNTASNQELLQAGIDAGVVEMVTVGDKQPSARDKFSKELERKGVATDGNGDTYKIIQSEADPEAYLIEKTDSDGNRTTHGSPNEKWDMGYTREKIMQRAWFEGDDKPAKPAKPAKEESAEFTQAKADLDKALGDLGEIFLSANLFSKKAVPTELNAADLMPVLTRVMDAAFRMGYARFKDNARFVLNTIRDRFGDAAADSIQVDDLQGAYIAMKKGTDSKLTVISVESIEEIMADSQDADNTDNIETQADAEGTTDDTRGNDLSNETALVHKPSQENTELDTGGLYNASLSSGRPDADGNGQPDPDRTGRADSVDGVQAPVLSGTATGLESVANSPTGRKSDRPNKVAGENPGNFIITDELELGSGTTKQKIDANLAAIKTLKQIESEGRFATTDEQAILAKYVGWGGLAKVFDGKVKDATDMYGRAYRELKETLTASEWRDAIKSTPNAHYTAKPIIDAMWQAARHFGFKGGRVLEPTVGVGNFIGLQPDDLAASSQWFASELDSVSGRIAKALYPDSTILPGTGFEDAPFAEGVFDLAIGNPPFGSLTMKDGKYADLDGMKIHNYIIGKSGKHLRPGGVMAMVVTHRFLDAANPEARDVLAKDFNFVGAIRLPNDAFLKNAGTEVTTDIIFLQKRHAGDTSKGDESWLNNGGTLVLDGNKIPVNQYFANNPQNILGRSAMDGTMYAGGRKSGGEYTVHSDGRDLSDAINKIIKDDWSAMAGIMREQEADTEIKAVMLQQSDIPIGGMSLTKDGKILYRDMDDDSGNAVIKEITADSYWKENAEAWADIEALLNKAAENNGVLSDQEIDELLDNAKIAYLANGDKRSSPTKAEAAVYEVMDALTQGALSPWRFDAGLSEVAKAKNSRILGQNSFVKLKSLLDLRNRTLDLVKAEFADADNIESLRSDLNKAYEAFVKKHGFISDPANVRLLNGDYGIELGLESSYQPKVTKKQAEATGDTVRKASAKKSALLSTRVNYPRKEITTANDPKDALHISISERGGVDLAYMAQLVGKPIQDVIDSLSQGDNAEIFFDPETSNYEHADAYLSGNVRHKLQVARENDLLNNIAALEKVQPEPKTKEQIRPSIRSAWIPQSVFTEFLRDLGLRGEAIVIESIGRISSGDGSGQLSEFGIQFKDDDVTVNQIFDHAASGKALKVVRRTSDGKSWVDQEATARVSALVERMGKVFAQWAYTDEGRTQTIVDAYNQKMNTHRERIFDGVRYLRTVGANPNIKLRRTQKNAAWRMIQSAATLLDHVVGAGKTFTVITGVMERRRLGLSRKPLVVVPNHLVVQWASEWYELYPTAKLLAATPDDFTPKNRRRLLARMATGDFDAIILGHSTLNKIEAPKADMEMVLNEKIAQLESAMNEAKAKGESSRTVKQMGDRITKLQESIEKLQDDSKRDKMGMDFATMGVDFLAVDEAHEFKNLQYATAGERVVGMNDPNGSQKAFHLYTLVRGLQERDGAVTFATGTPLSNSLVELYTMMSYMATSELKLRNQDHFDAWSGSYTETATKPEYTATQKLKPRRILAGLMNLDSLRQLYMQFADVITMKDLKRIYTAEREEANRLNGTNERTDFPVPKVKTGGRVLDNGEATPAQKTYTDYLVARMKGIEKNASKDEYRKKDNALWVLSDARKMSLDIRTVDHQASRDENGKVMRSARRIKDIYDRWDADKGTQMVFSDLSTPSKNAEKDAKKLIREAAGKVYSGSKQKAMVKQLLDMRYTDAWDRIIADSEQAIEDFISSDQQAKADALGDYFNGLEDVEGTLATAEAGFSVYDDLRTVLTEMGIPETEIAFIHDYNTPDQKKKLFNRVNSGLVRVIIGSTAKMGAGTNAQKRLVALHHLDAPWRPSDVEQREGRIIRQGNELYARDPDGFEVEIYAYSTAGTADTVMWQILQRKANAIEQFRDGDLNEMQEEGTDSDQYAEFMASSTGNPVFRLKMDAEKKALELQSEISGLLTAKVSAQGFLRAFDNSMRGLSKERDAYDGATIGDAVFEGDTGSIDELEAAMEKANEAYKTAYANYITKKHEIEDLYEAASAAGTSTADLPAMPTAPSKPSMARKSVREESGYARAVMAFLEKSANIGLGESLSMKIGDTQFVMKKSASAYSNDSSMFTLSAWRNGVTKPLYNGAMKNPAASDSMVKALMPTALNQTVGKFAKRAEREMMQLEQRAVSNRDLAEREIDTSLVDAAQETAEWFRTQVKFAEVIADRERAGRPNQYIANDKVRDLSDFSDKGDETRYEFESDGNKYIGTGVSAHGLYDARRESDGKPVIVKVSEVKDGSPVVASVTVEPAEAKAMMDAAMAEKALYSTTADPDIDFAREIINELTDVDELFRRPVSNSATLETVLSEVAASRYLGEDTRADERQESQADNRYAFRTESGKNFYVFTRDNEVWIDVSRLNEGDGGQAVYDAVANYAYNTNMVFAGDPEGLSKQAIVRRTTNMLSSALRFGTTRHLQPAKEQLQGDATEGIGKLEWSGSDTDKINSLIKTFLDNIQGQFPDIKRARYDFNSGQFLRADGVPIDRRAFDEIRDKGYSGRAQAARAGSATVRRAILIQSLVSSESGQRSGLLEKFLNGARQLVRNGDLDGLFSAGSVEGGLNLPAARKIIEGNKLLGRLVKSGKLKVQRDSSGRQGMYVGGTASVFANANTADSIEATAWHEVTHAAMDIAGDNFINPKVKAKLYAALQREVDRVKAGGKNDLMRRAIERTEYANTPDSQYLEEIAAYLVTEYVSDQSQAKGTVLAWIKDMLAAIKTAILRHTGLMVGAPTAADMSAIARAYADFVYRNNPPNPRGGKPTERAQPLYSTAMPKSIDDIRQAIERSNAAEDLKKPFARMWDGIKSQSLGALTLRQIGEVASGVLPAIKNQYIPLKDALEVEIRKWQDIGGQIAADRRKLSKKDNQALSELQHEATLAGVDPSMKFVPLDVDKIEARIKAIRAAQLGGDGAKSPEAIAKIKLLEDRIENEPKRKADYDRLKPMWDSLPRDGKDIYLRERSFHEQLNADRLQALEDKVERQAGSEKAKKELMAALQERFEAFKVNAPYFPLARYGDYWVFAEDAEGERTFNMFETANERDRFKEQIRKEGYKIIGSGMNLENMQRIDGVDASFVTEIDRLISQLGDDPMVNELRKQVYDLYLGTLPDLSARKHFIRRKKTKGFDEDQSRAFAHAVEHGSRDLGRLKYADQMLSVIRDIESTLKTAESDQVAEDLQADIDRLADYLENAADLTTQSIAQRFRAAQGKDKEQTELWRERRKIRDTMTRLDVEREIDRLRRVKAQAESLRGVGDLTFAAYATNEIRKSHDAIMNPNTHPVAQALNSFGFFWFLGLTPAAAFVNLTQTAIIAMPLIGAKFGYAKANKLLKSATAEFFSRGSAEKGFSVLNSKKLTADERKAFQVFYGEGLIDNTLAHDTAGIAENGINTGSLRHKLMDAASFMFHHAERMNREVTALAAYRAAREAGQDHRQAIDSAAAIVWNGHFDYTTTNRARFLRGNVMRVVTQFKQYSQNMIYLYGRLGYQALRGTGIEKAEARKALTGIIAMQFGLAGAAGLPLVGLFAGVAQLLADVGGDDDEPVLIEAEIRAAVTRALTDLLGDDAGRFASTALSSGIVNAMTPINLSGRISHSDMLIRMSDMELEGRSAAYDTMKAIGGVATSYIEMPFVAIEHLRNENYSKAAETMLPKFARDILKGVRFGTEDALTSRGYLFKEMSFAEVAAQLAGFSSSELAEQYGQNTARGNLEKRLKDRRSQIMDRMVQARSGQGDLAAAQQELREWNRKHPRNQITIKNILQSERGRKRYAEGMNDGRYTTKRYQDVSERYDWTES